MSKNLSNLGNKLTVFDIFASRTLYLDSTRITYN